MKKLLAMVLVLGMASTAFGAGIEFRLGAGGIPETFPEGPGVTLMESEIAEIQVWATGLDLAMGYNNAVFGFDTTPPAVEDFELIGAIPGPDQYGVTYSPGEPGPGVGIQLNDFALLVYAYPYVYEQAEVLLVTLIVHCTGLESYTVVSFDTLQGGASVTDSSQAGYPIDFGLSKFVINQIPEPASLALLALGGLALIRRR